jgi:hypothetical protein
MITLLREKKIALITSTQNKMAQNYAKLRLQQTTLKFSLFFVSLYLFSFKSTPISSPFPRNSELWEIISTTDSKLKLVAVVVIVLIVDREKIVMNIIM